MQKYCRECKRSFQTIHKTQIWCSEPCRMEGWRKRIALRSEAHTISKYKQKIKSAKSEHISINPLTGETWWV